MDDTLFTNFNRRLVISNEAQSYLESIFIKYAYLTIKHDSSGCSKDQVIFYIARFYHHLFNYSLASKLYQLLINRFNGYNFCYFYLATIKESLADFKGSEYYFRLFFNEYENFTARSYYHTHIIKSPCFNSNKLYSYFNSFSENYNLNFSSFKYDCNNKKIRVGYICSFWQTSTAYSQLLPFINSHDKENFTILGYGSDANEKVNSCFDHFTKIHNRSDLDIINKLRNDKLDIIIDCSGFSPYNALVQLSARCAPVQICYMNHSATTGLQNIDYILADTISIPPQEEKFFTEKILRKQGCFFCFDFRQQIFPDITNSPCIKNDHITFGFLGGHTVKINDKMVETWSYIINYIPNSKLLIINNEFKSISVLRNFKKKFSKYGIREHSLDFRPGVSRDEILQCYNEIDISFDTWPYCGGNTLAESLWMGVPCVSLLGERFSSRYGSSILNACDLDFLIVESFDEYIEKCRELASNYEKLNSLRTTMRERITKSGFNDSQSFAKSLEEIFSNLVNKVRKDD